MAIDDRRLGRRECPAIEQTALDCDRPSSTHRSGCRPRFPTVRLRVTTSRCVAPGDRASRAVHSAAGASSTSRAHLHRSAGATRRSRVRMADRTSRWPGIPQSRLLPGSHSDAAARLDLDVVPRYRPAVFDNVPIMAIMTMESAGAGTRYVFTALHRDADDDQPEWNAVTHDFATVWRTKPKWVVSRTLRSVPDAPRSIQQASPTTQCSRASQPLPARSVAKDDIRVPHGDPDEAHLRESFNWMPGFRVGTVQLFLQYPTYDVLSGCERFGRDTLRKVPHAPDIARQLPRAFACGKTGVHAIRRCHASGGGSGRAAYST